MFTFFNIVTTIILWIVIWHFPKSTKPLIIAFLTMAVTFFLLAALISHVRGI